MLLRRCDYVSFAVVVSVSVVDGSHLRLSSRDEDSCQRDGGALQATAQLVRRRSRRQGA